MNNKKKKIRPLRPKKISELSRSAGQHDMSSPRQIEIPAEASGPIMVGIPTGRFNISSATVKSLFASFPHFGRFRGCTFYSHAGSLIQLARQETLRVALETGMRWLWFIDDDMSFPPHTVAKLVKDCIDNDFTVCSALSNKRVPPFSPTVGMTFSESGKPELTPEDVPSEGVHEVAFSGLACTVIDLDKIRKEKLDKENLFFLSIADDGGLVGEDLAFCKKLHEHGLKVGLDADVWTGHIGTQEFTPQVWFEWWKKRYIDEKVKNEKSKVPETGVQAVTLEK